MDIFLLLFVQRLYKQRQILSARLDSNQRLLAQRGNNKLAEYLPKKLMNVMVMKTSRFSVEIKRAVTFL